MATYIVKISIDNVIFYIFCMMNIIQYFIKSYTIIGTECIIIQSQKRKITMAIENWIWQLHIRPSEKNNIIFYDLRLKRTKTLSVKGKINLQGNGGRESCHSRRVVECFRWVSWTPRRLWVGGLARRGTSYRSCAYSGPDHLNIVSKSRGGLSSSRQRHIGETRSK